MTAKVNRPNTKFGGVSYYVNPTTPTVRDGVIFNTGNTARLTNRRIGLDVKYINALNANTPVKRFSLPNQINTDPTYTKPSKTTTYTANEITRYGLQYQFVGVYITTRNGLDTLISFAELYVHSSRVEIYNVYTHPLYRRGGYAGVLFRLIKTLHPNGHLWLGVKEGDTAGAPDFKKRIETYAKFGFTSGIKLTNETPSGKTMPFYFIEMKYKPSKTRTSADVVNKSVNKAVALMTAHRNSGGSTHKFIKAKFILDGNYINRVKGLLGNNKEHGGAIQFYYAGYERSTSRYTFQGQGIMNRHVPGYGGPNVSQFMVVIPGTNIPSAYMITWHTHPTICYPLAGVCTGMPSSADIRLYVARYIDGTDKTGVNLIFAAEGIYVIRLQTKFMTAVEQERDRVALGGLNIRKFDIIADEIHRRTTYNPNMNARTKIAAYKAALETIQWAGFQVFEIDFRPYPLNNGSADINVTLSINSLTTVKQRGRIRK